MTMKPRVPKPEIDSIELLDNEDPFVVQIKHLLKTLISKEDLTQGESMLQLISYPAFGLAENEKNEMIKLVKNNKYWSAANKFVDLYVCRNGSKATLGKLLDAMYDIEWNSLIAKIDDKVGQVIKLQNWNGNNCDIGINTNITKENRDIDTNSRKPSLLDPQEISVAETPIFCTSEQPHPSQIDLTIQENPPSNEEALSRLSGIEQVPCADSNRENDLHNMSKPSLPSKLPVVQNAEGSQLKSETSPFLSSSRAKMPWSHSKRNVKSYMCFSVTLISFLFMCAVLIVIAVEHKRIPDPVLQQSKTWVPSPNFIPSEERKGVDYCYSKENTELVINRLDMNLSVFCPEKVTRIRFNGHFSIEEYLIVLKKFALNVSLVVFSLSNCSDLDEISKVSLDVTFNGIEKVELMDINNCQKLPRSISLILQTFPKTNSLSFLCSNIRKADVASVIRGFKNLRKVECHNTSHCKDFPWPIGVTRISRTGYRPC